MSNQRLDLTEPTSEHEMQRPICVVLNNQHHERVADFVQRCGLRSDDRMIFQPYTEKRLRRLRELDDNGRLPVPIYLVSGQYGSTATAAAELVKVEYRDELPPTTPRLLEELLPATDDRVYATNLLYLAHGRSLLDAPLAVESFVKASDDRPLLPGRWPAVVCYEHEEARVLKPATRSSLSGPQEAVEGHRRLLLVHHRQREQGLRKAKIRATLDAAGRLKCEVPGCSFDFEEIYGELGKDYAEVHHLSPLAASAAPRRTSLNDLVIVCANCHAMIHRDGESRSLQEISVAMGVADEV